MRRLLWTSTGAALLLLLTASKPCLAQTATSGVTRSTPAYSASPYYGAYSPFGAPGYYGMAWGVPSYGVPRTYTAFSSPYGLGYGYGYGPSSFLPGPYGVEMWRPGVSTTGYTYAPAAYRTFPVPYRVGWTPGVGMYAPGFGPPFYQGW
jgi:hypothetical protein